MKQKVLTIWITTIAMVVTGTTAIHAEMYLEPWQLKGEMTVGRHGLTAATVGDYVYSIGGLVIPGSPGNAQNVVERYNPTTDMWEQVASMPTARHGLDSAVVDGYIYAIGGHVGNSRNENEKYDPSTNTWQTLSSKPTAVSGPGVAAFGGKIYTFGGNSYGSYQSIIEVYDPSTDTWENAGNMPAAGEPWRAVSLSGKIYLAGGLLGGNEDSLWAYDPVSGTWDTTLPSMNEPRFGHELVVVGDYLFAIGGNTTGDYLSSVEWWTPGAPSWTLDESLNISRRHFGAEAIGNTIYVFGGYNGADMSSTESAVVVPVPGAFALGSIGLGMAGWLCKRKKS